MMLADLIVFQKPDDILTAKAGDKVCLTIGDYNGQKRNLVLMFEQDSAGQLVADFISILKELETKDVNKGGV